MLSEFLRRVQLLLWAVAACGLAVACLVLFVLFVVAVPLVFVWVGLPLLFGVLLVVRPIADVHRRAAGRLLQRDVASPYLAQVHGNLLARLRSLVLDPATWRDVAWLALNATVGLALSITAIVEAVVDLLLWWLPPGMLAQVHAYLAAALLGPTDRTSQAQRIQQLTESRADTVDSSAAELRRIERDLHDGAQARLVALGISLGLAEEQLARDPEQTRALLAEARESSGLALAELRDLVRGIHPPVLADRGLLGAVQALALSAPLEVTVSGDLPGRFPAPVESAAYFAVAEVLTNAVKHSGASRVLVRLGYAVGAVRIEVSDDGRGGADPAGGTGLAGIRRRLAAFDGTLALESPPAGGTRVAIVLPCASSSPKISPSSGTA